MRGLLGAEEGMSLLRESSVSTGEFHGGVRGRRVVFDQRSLFSQ